MKEPIDQLRDVHSIQGRDGCWDIDDYMLGLFNGLELALSIMEQREVKYKTRKEPKREWVGLTDEEYLEIKDEYSNEFGLEAKLADDFFKTIEAKLKEKNT